MRTHSGLLVSAAAVAAVAGSAMGAVMVTPANVITWGGNSQGRSLAAVQPAGLTWAWTIRCRSSTAAGLGIWCRGTWGNR